MHDDQAHKIPANPTSAFRLPVLLYHDVTDEVSDVNVISPETFCTQITTLQKHHTFVALETALNSFCGGTPVQSETLLLTFDDGYSGIKRFAFPLLRELSIPFVLFVPVNYLGASNDWNKRCSYRTRHMNTEEIKEMFPWCSLGSHGLSHHNMLKLSCRECHIEADISRRTLETLFSVQVMSYAYPYGVWNGSIERIVAQTYEVAFSVDNGVSNWRAGPHRILRLEPKQWHSPSDVERMIAEYAS
jgi:peptidoglycan/xylan/chitin deacetylase (PgdA/CDA1 family)